MSAPLRKLVIVDTATRELWRVAEGGDLIELAAILSRGVSVNARNEHGMTALMRAARAGHIEMVQALLECGADPNVARNDKFTALALAAFFGHTEVVRILIEYGARTEVVTRSGTSPRMWAAARTFKETACYLEQQPAPVPAPAPLPMRPVPAPAPAPIFAEPAPAPVIRTLKDPPEIWDLVHEVPRSFNPRTAFFSRIMSMNWLVVAGAFAGLLLLVAGGVGLFVLRNSGVSDVPPVPTPVQTAAQVVVTAPAAPVNDIPTVVVARRAPVPRQSKARAVTEEKVVAVAPSREEPQVAAPQVEKPKPTVKSPPNPALSPHLIAPAKSAKVIQWP